MAYSSASSAFWRCQISTNLTSNPSAKKWNLAQDHSSIASKFTCSIRRGDAQHQAIIATPLQDKIKEARHVLMSKIVEDPFQSLVMIDTIQRLGIAHHFQEEVKTLLQKQYVGGHCLNRHDLHEVALTFRLLRQQGYHVPADVFNKFMDKNGHLEQKLSQELKGLIGLYEAAQLSIPGEDILDQAANLCNSLLMSGLNLNESEARVVETTLKYPYHRSLSRFMPQNFISGSQGEEEWIHVVQDLAILDYKMVQPIYHKEMRQISLWWKDLGLAKELKFARNQPLKWYMWSTAVLADPRFTEQRVDLTKPISFIYIIDDIFDVYGTLDELTLFTEAVTRWDTSKVDHLPDYMKTCFKALYDITNEIGCKFCVEHGWNPIETLKKTWVSLCNAFLVEAKWFNSKHLPEAEEYLRNGIISSGVHVVLVHLFFLLGGEGISNENIDVIKGDTMPGIIYFTAKILRLYDDLGSAKDENQDGHDGSYVEYYMKEHQGCSVESAREYTLHMISDAWKCLNKECLSPNPFSTSFINASLNVARMVPLMYTYDDNHNLPSLKEHMKSFLYKT
uniref:Terpene synthase 1 n=1 Tax=Paeonia delavayi TaxID=40707 RepID=A0A9E8GEC8_9MAGN|nr:terpene synthase 1 [Paeonia delavayi]